jgi:hypothetical protein
VTGCDHEFDLPIGMLGPYPVEGCIHCNAGIIVAVEGQPDPFDMITATLDRRDRER